MSIESFHLFDIVDARSKRGDWSEVFVIEIDEEFHRVKVHFLLPQGISTIQVISPSKRRNLARDREEWLAFDSPRLAVCYYNFIYIKNNLKPPILTYPHVCEANDKQGLNH